MIEEKISRTNESTLLVSEDGRLFEADAAYSQKLREIVDEAKAALMEEVEEVREAVQGRLPELLADAKDILAEAVEVAEDAVEDAVDSALDRVDEAQEALGAEDSDDTLNREDEEPVEGVG